MRRPDDRSRPSKPRPAPDRAALRAASLTHLARYAATEAGLTRVLTRKVERWARLAEGDPDAIAASAAAARAAIAEIVARLAAAGAVSDSAYAESRARSLARAGRSSRAIGAHLASRGVPRPLADAASPDAAGELAAALIHARKRRMGPWRKTQAGPDTARRELASFARAGYAQNVARRALAADRDEAEALITAFRAGL